MLRQALAITRMNLASLPSRIGSSLIVVVGIGGVVAVLLGLLAMSQGFRLALVELAKPDRALILRGGSNSEMEGFVSNEQLAILATRADLEVVSGEIFASISTYLKDGTAADVAARGVTERAFQLRPELQISAGRMFASGRDEVIVGVAAAQRYQGLELGAEVEARNRIWTVAGHFAAGGTAVESEVWLNLASAQDAFRRPGGVSVVRARIAPGEQIADVATRIHADRQLDLTLVPETDFFARQSAARVALINTFAYVIAGIMAVGSAIAALNTMYTAVSGRTVEIATLRSLGFGRLGVVTSVLLESMLLAIVGGVIGAGFVYALLDGYAAASFNSDTASQMAFAFRVTPGSVAVGLAWALALGFGGGLLPAVRAARLPITQGLRVS